MPRSLTQCPCFLVGYSHYLLLALSGLRPIPRRDDPRLVANMTEEERTLDSTRQHAGEEKQSFHCNCCLVT